MIELMEENNVYHFKSADKRNDDRVHFFAAKDASESVHLLQLTCEISDDSGASNTVYI